MKRLLMVMALIAIGAGLMANEERPDPKKTLAIYNYRFSLQHELAAVRKSAINQIERYDLKELAHDLVLVMRNDPDESVKMAAARALITLRDTEGIRAVKALVEQPDETPLVIFCKNLVDSRIDEYEN